MNWLNKLERKYRRYAIHDLMLYITSTMLVVYVFEFVIRGFSVTRYLALIPSLVMQGQIWRLITFIFVPPNASIIGILLILYFYYFIGGALQRTWGDFKFNVYYLFGILGTIIASMLTGSFGTSTYINLSLFLAFAALYPENEVLLFFVIPMKIKYLAYLDWAIFAITLLTGSMSEKAAVVASLVNFFIFFGPDYIKSYKQKQRYKEFKRNMNNDNDRFRR